MAIAPPFARLCFKARELRGVSDRISKVGREGVRWGVEGLQMKERKGNVQMEE